jgi:pyruvate,water dikinase
MDRLHPWIARAGDARNVSEIGGKAAGLDRLVALGLPVPDYLTLTAEAYRACCPSVAVPGEDGSDLSEALDQLWNALGGGSCSLAVRSSAVAEDGAARSWAGQMDTFLNVTTREGLRRAVHGCWRSLHGERAIAYRTLPGLGDTPRPDAAAMAVVVQKMLVPQASGVVFTIDPVTGRSDRLIVSAVLGMGEGLVSGALDADTYVVGRDGALIESHLVVKDRRVVAAPRGGTVEESVAAVEANAAALDEALLSTLTHDACSAEAAAGLPLDIEFAVDRGRLFFLQARPVTTPPIQAAANAANRLVWDNANIVESYPGLTLPLTFTFIRRAYHAVYWQFCQLLGMGESEIRANDHMLWNMLGLHQGQVYYNLRNWYRLVSILPGFHQNRRFMEGMMGVVHDGGEASEDRVSRSSGALALAFTAWRAVWLQFTLERRIGIFHRHFDEVYKDFAALPYEQLEPSEILEHYRSVEQRLLWRWKAPIVNDFSVMIFYGLLKHLTVRWDVDAQGNLHNALMAKQGGIESTEVSDHLENIADAVAADTDLGRAVLDASAAEAFGLVQSDPRCGPLLDEYMERFGDRCVAELKLESRTMHDDPTPLMSALQASVRRGGAKAAPVRPDAAAGAHAAVSTRLSFWQRAVYKWVLKRAGRGIRNRENQRLARTRAFALVRRMMRALGRGLVRDGILGQWDDVFYMELEELMGLCDGTATLSDPRALVAARRSEYKAFGTAPPLPDRFVTVGTTSASERLSDESVADTDEAGVLRGLAAYPGVVEESAVVLLEADPRAQLDGEILVTRQTDPGWIILFPSIGGLVVERGSMLSHSAIVAREMGIPAVVGVRGATEAIQSGDTVRLNGAAGTVQVVQTGPGGMDR